MPDQVGHDKREGGGSDRMGKVAARDKRISK